MEDLTMTAIANAIEEDRNSLADTDLVAVN
jgi:hypothetical protein